LEIKLFTQPYCTRCPQVKEALKLAGLQWTEYNIETADGLAELMMTGSELKETPILVVDDEVIDGFDAQLSWIKQQKE